MTSEILLSIQIFILLDLNNNTSRFGSSSFEKGDSNSKMSRVGAGVILKSSLVLHGWKFQTVLLTESDDRFLFDLEVGHFYSNASFLDVIANEPGQSETWT